MTVGQSWHRGFVAPQEIQCGDKHTFASMAEGRRMARRRAGEGVPGLRPYRCPHCNGIHLGHPPGKKAPPTTGEAQ